MNNCQCHICDILLTDLNTSTLSYTKMYGTNFLYRRFCVDCSEIIEDMIKECKAALLASKHKED